MRGIAMVLVATLGFLMVMIGVSIPAPVWAKILIVSGVMVLIGVLLFIAESVISAYEPPPEQDDDEVGKDE